MAGSIPELQHLTDKLYNYSTAYGMEVSLKKSKIMVNYFSNSYSNLITMNSKTLEIVDKFKYLGATLTKTGKSEKEIKIRLATEIRLCKPKYNMEKQKHLITYNIHLYKYRILSILLYGCDS